MSGGPREYKSADGTSFKFEEVNKLLKSKQRASSVIEELKMEEIIQ